MRRRLRDGARFVPGGDLYGKSVGLTGAVQIVDVDKPETRRAGLRGQTRLLENTDVTNGPRLRAEPTTGPEVIGDHFAFEQGALPVVEQGSQIRRRVHDRNHALLAQTPALRLRLQHKPIMRMRRERDDVGRLLDGRK